VRGGAVAGVLFHTDQGSEYTANLFVEACRSAGVTQSMGRTGSALDNAVSEASTPPWNGSYCVATTSPPVSKRATRSRPGSTTTTTTEGIPPTACSAPSTTNLSAQRDRPSSTKSSYTTTGRRHEPGADGFAAALPPAAPRKATGPPLRPQGSLRDRCATDLRPALDPGASTAPYRAAARAGARRCPPGRAALNRKITTNQSLRFKGIAAVTKVKKAIGSLTGGPKQRTSTSSTSPHTSSAPS
jgi:hypothetical protein